MSILIVDDNPDISEALAEILNMNGYNSVKTAKSAEAAFKLINEWDVHLIISDLLMPKISSLELYEQVMKLPHPPEFILITGSDLEDVEEMSNLDHGKLTVLQKPFSSHLLVALIGSLKHKVYQQPLEPSSDPTHPKDLPHVS